MSTTSEVDIIQRIQREWIESVRSLAGQSTKQALDILSLMFIEPNQFILEFLQNAEDARFEVAKRGGFFRVELFRDKVIIEHNGKPFDERDIRNLCSISSSKEPSMGYKGYIGIGWKSVFKVSSDVEVYSNKYCFKFSKDYWFKNERELKERYGLKPDELPWQVIPIPIGRVEYIPPEITRFVVHLDNPSYYYDVARALDELRPHIFLFLEYINKIEVIDHVVNRNKVIEWFVSREDSFNDVKVQEIIVHYYEDVQKGFDKFLVFKKEFDVPEEVREDPTTKDAKRNNVSRREVAIAFALDLGPLGERVKPVEERQFWGIYSFLPLHEVRSGLRFLIQADFIVHPGRRYINYEAKWNRWLMQCIAEVVKIAIMYLEKRFPKNYLEVFEYREVDDMLFHRLIKPTIVETIDSILKDPEVLSIKGEVVRLSSTVKFDEKVAELIKQKLINEEDLKYIYGSKRYFLDPNVKLRQRDEYKVEKLDLVKLLNANLIAAKMKEDPEVALKLLAEIYRLARDRNIYIPLERRFVITKSGEIKIASEVYYSKIPKEVNDLMKKFSEVEEYIKKLDFIHEKLTEYLDESLIDWIGVKKIDFKEVCARVLLPKIYADDKGEPPSKEDLIMITVIVKRAGLLPDNKPIWVVTTGEDIRKSRDVYYPMQHFKPVEVFKELGIEFLYLEKYLGYDNDIEGWEKFFKSALVRGLTPCIYWSGGVYREIHRDYNEVINKIKERLDMTRDKNVHRDYLTALKQLYQSLSSCWDKPMSVKVFTDDNRVVDSTECLLHDAYNPEERWVRWRDEGFDIGSFVSPDYLKNPIDTDTQTWRDFLVKAVGVKEKASKEDIERFALWYTERKLQEKGFRIKGRRGEGYDLEVEDKEGKIIYVEVKGRKELGDIELTEMETRKAMNLKEQYWLIVVKDIPNNPRIVLAKDLVSLSTKLTLTISKRQLEERGEYLD